jgi:DNA (cytosine-5)-methyltransferase 1
MKALDLFCGAGGATRGLKLAGFHVTGVDLVPQPHYCGDSFICADVLGLSIDFVRSFGFVWASPPCQAHSSMRVLHNAKRHLDLIGPTRELLTAAGVPYAIENVVGAPLISPVLLCGTMFGLETPCGAELQRHRLIETSFPLLAPTCQHRAGANVIGIYGGHYRNRRRPTGSNHVPQTDFSPADARIAMGVDWVVTGDEISQAIPPAYAKFVARVWLNQEKQNERCYAHR